MNSNHNIQKMVIAVGCDHGGFPLKDSVIRAIRDSRHEVLDLGTYSSESTDYPDYGEKIGRAIQEGQADRGVAMCGSGVGICITLNKIKGIYAAICHDTYSAHQGVEHDNMNVLCLGGRVIGSELACELVKAFLSANFIGTGNYLRRVEKVQVLEKDFGKPNEFN